MSGWVEVALGVIGWEWVERTVEDGDGLRLLVWTAVFSALFAAAGFLVGRRVGRAAERRFAQDLRRETDELKARCAALVSQSVELEKRVRELKAENAGTGGAAGSMQNCTSDKNEDDQGFVLEGDAALNFVASLPDNQRAILRRMYESGGSIDEDPFDGDLQALQCYGLVIRPGIFYAEMPCTWSLPPNVNAILRDHPHVLDGRADEGGAKPRGVPEHVDWTRYSRFQLQFLLEFAEKPGPLEYRASDCGYIELEEEGVVRRDESGAWGSSGAVFWRISPDWRAAVRRDEGKMREALGKDAPPAAGVAGRDGATCG